MQAESKQEGAVGRPLLAELSPELTVRLIGAGRKSHYRDGQLIHDRGDARPGLSLVLGGAVRFGNPGADGTYVETSTLGPGHCFGEATLFANLPRTHEARAVGATEVCQLTRNAFQKLMDDAPALARAMLVVTTTRLYAALDQLDDVRRLSLPVRAAKLLLYAEESGIVALNQTALAERAGVSRVSMGKALSKLQADGLIDLGYGRIAICSVDAMRDWVAERNTVLPIR